MKFELTQFGHSICTLHNDNARDYFSTSFNNINASYSMVHQSLCPRTPQHNGIIESKHDYVIGNACTILIHINALLIFQTKKYLTLYYFLMNI